MRVHLARAVGAREAAISCLRRMGLQKSRLALSAWARKWTWGTLLSNGRKLLPATKKEKPIWTRMFTVKLTAELLNLGTRVKSPQQSRLLARNMCGRSEHGS